MFKKLQVEEIHFVGFLSKLLETRMIQVLRFKHGQVSVFCRFFEYLFPFIRLLSSLVTFLFQIYSAGVSVFLGGNKPSRIGPVRGDISINFSCDPEISSKLVCTLSQSTFFYFISIIKFS